MQIESAEAPYVQQSSAIIQATSTPAIHANAMYAQSQTMAAVQTMNVPRTTTSTMAPCDPEAERRALEEVEQLRTALREKQQLLEAKVQQIDTMINNLQMHQTDAPTIPSASDPSCSKFNRIPLPTPNPESGSQTFSQMLKEPPREKQIK